MEVIEGWGLQSNDPQAVEVYLDKLEELLDHSDLEKHLDLVTDQIRR